jgi:hypothetical protein
VSPGLTKQQLLELSFDQAEIYKLTSNVSVCVL